MNHSARVTRRPSRVRPPAARTATAVIATAGLALLAAACGSPSPTSSGGSANAAGSVSSQSPHSQTLAYSQCMRSNGLSGFPDPPATGKPRFPTAQELGVSDSQYQTANNACQHLLPNGGNAPSQTQVEQYRSGMLRYAQCMRAHKISNFPDPDSQGHLDLQGAGVDVNSAQFNTAYQACQSKLPGPQTAA